MCAQRIITLAETLESIHLHLGQPVTPLQLSTIINKCVTRLGVALTISGSVQFEVLEHGRGPFGFRSLIPDNTPRSISLPTRRRTYDSKRATAQLSVLFSFLRAAPLEKPKKFSNERLASSHHRLIAVPRRRAFHLHTCSIFSSGNPTRHKE